MDKGTPIIRNLHIIQTHVEDGVMNTAAAFYKEGMSAEERKAEFLKRRMVLGDRLGFNGRMMFMADQVNKDGSYKIIDDELIASNPNGWADINEDILVIGKDIPGVAIGHPVADCPVLVVTDALKGVTAISHCSAAMVDMKLPKFTVEALRDAYDSKLSNMYAYITASAGPNWTYDSWPRWATENDVWKDCIVQKEGLYYIDIKKAISKQLDNTNIAGYSMNDDDTITDPRYFSNSAASKGEQEKSGRHFAGAFYK